MLGINVLGPLEIVGLDQKLPKKAKGLIAYLAIEGRASRSVLADLLWPNQVRDQGHHSLRNCLLEIRKTSLASAFRADHQTCWLVDIETDYHRLMSVTDSPTKRSGLQEIAQLYRGPFLDHFDVSTDVYHEWRRHRGNEVLEAILALLLRLTDGEDLKAALAAGRRLTEIDPLSEEGCQAFLRVCQRSGQRITGLRAYKSHAGLLWRELQVKPSAETRAIATSLAAGMQLERDAAA